jgi:hypothetical protein
MQLLPLCAACDLPDDSPRWPREAKMPYSKAFLLLILLSAPAWAQYEPSDHSAEIYGLASVTGGNIPGGNMSAAGFAAGGVWKASPRVGLVGDFGRHFVSDAHSSFNTYLAGIRMYGEERYRLSGFFQILTGAEQTISRHQPADWNYALSPGVGADIRLTDRVVWRAIQVDLTLNGGAGVLRVSSGFAYRFGK